MGILDVILLVCFIPAAVEGLWKGLIRQVIGIASVLIGLWAAVHFAPEAREWIALQFENPDPRFVKALAFGGILLGVMLILRILGSLITNLFNAASLGLLNRTLGLVFGVVKTALILALLVHVFDGLNAKWEMVSADTLSSSQVYMWLKDLALKIFPFLKELFAK